MDSGTCRPPEGQSLENCRCDLIERPSVSVLRAKIKEELTLDVKKLSYTRRKKQSASDPRASSTCIAVFFMCLLFAAVGALLLSDVPQIYRDFKIGWCEKRQKNKSKSTEKEV
ncbi:hypothetical protein ACOMHN_018895 [Nucella lapillus]